MCSSPDGYGSISSTYVLACRRPAPGLGVRRRGRPARPPRRCCHFCSIVCGSYRSIIVCLRVQKSLSFERPVGSCRGGRRGRFLLYGRSCFTARMLAGCIAGAALPGVARESRRELRRRRLAASELAPSAFGTPLVVYCEQTLRGAGARVPAARRRTRSSSTGRRRSRTSRCCACSPRRGSAPTSRRSASSPSRARPGSTASGWSSTGTTSRTRSSRAPPRPARSSSLDALDEADARGGGRRPPRARPRHARRRGRHARGDPDGAPRLEVRAAADDALEAIAPRARRRARRRRAARPRRLAAR